VRLQVSALGACACMYEEAPHLPEDTKDILLGYQLGDETEHPVPPLTAG
jgi:hypothetical protein